MHLFQPGDAATPFRPHLANDRLTTRGKLLHTCGEVNQEDEETSLVLSFPDGRGLLAGFRTSDEEKGRTCEGRSELYGTGKNKSCFQFQVSSIPNHITSPICVHKLATNN